MQSDLALTGFPTNIKYLMKLFIFNVTTEDNGRFSCLVAADSFDRYDTFLFESDVLVDVVGKLKAKFRNMYFYC